MREIINPTMKAMQETGSPFSGFLFAGLILTKNGPKLLEFNTRLGDPETQSILPRLKSDLFLLMKKFTPLVFKIFVILFLIVLSKVVMLDGIFNSY